MLAAGAMNFGWGLKTLPVASSNGIQRAHWPFAAGGTCLVLPKRTPSTSVPASLAINAKQGDEIAMRPFIAHAFIAAACLLAPVAAGCAPAWSKEPFTITNDPPQGTVVNTMLERTCTGTV